MACVSKNPIISLSFKENELWIYEKLSTYSSATGIIKDILKSYFLEEEKNQQMLQALKDQNIQSILKDNPEIRTNQSLKVANEGIRSRLINTNETPNEHKCDIDF